MSGEGGENWHALPRMELMRTPRVSEARTMSLVRGARASAMQRAVCALSKLGGGWMRTWRRMVSMPTGSGTKRGCSDST